MKGRNRRLCSALVALGLALILLVGWGSGPARSSSTTVLITGVYYEAYAPGQADEAFRLQNISNAPVDLTGWTVTDKEGTLTLQDTLASGASIWITCEALAFADQFGLLANYEYCDDTDPAVPNLSTSGTFAFNDDGDEVVLRDASAVIVDSVVFEDGDPSGTDWSGLPVEPYGPTTAFSKKGQVLYRKLDQSTGQLIPDTDTAADWAQATDDDINGKKVQYPGWDLEAFFFPETFTQQATLTYAVAPDHIYETVLAEINQATSSIFYEGYTFNNAHLADAIVARMQANPGMTVRILLEGEPVGGIDDQEKWICQQIENAGGEVYFMYNDSDADVYDRYTYQHGKWMIIDEETLLTGSENLNYSSMPADDKADGTEGNRGVWLITDAPSAIAHALDVFQHDLDPENHNDLFRWDALDPTYGAPSPGFTPDYTSGGTSYAVQFPTPLTIDGTFSFEMVHSPETSLRDSDSLLGMVARAGAGDTVLVEQLYEYQFWGPTSSNPTDDPNPRLEAYIDAARREAEVRILLDSVFDDPGDVRSNTATCAYVNGLASAESLDLACKLTNPTGTGIHNKMVLVNDGGQGYVHTGSINGSENSSKNNREFAVQVQSNAAYAYLADVFWYDWGEDEDYFVFLPMVMRNYPLRYIAFSPYVDGYDAEYGPHPPPQLIDTLLDTVVKQTGFRTIMTYGVLNGLDYTFEAARNRGLKVIAIIWLGEKTDVNDASITLGIEKAKQYADTIIKLSCGSELRIDGEPAVVEPIIRDCVTRLREAGVPQPIGNIDTWWNWCDEAWPCQRWDLADALDWIGINVFPWWENKYSGLFPCTTAAEAPVFHVARYQDLINRYPEKEVLLTEFGWPAGPEGYSETNEYTQQQCGVASESNQRLVIAQTLALLDQMDLRGVVFEAFREPWKERYEGPVGPYWGICQGYPPYECNLP